jgi:hypothetical protein
MILVLKSLVQGFTDLFHPEILKILLLFVIGTMALWTILSWVLTHSLGDLLTFISTLLPKHADNILSIAQMLERNSYGFKVFAFILLFFLLSPIVSFISTLIFSIVIVFWSVSHLKKHHYTEIKESTDVLNFRLIRASLLFGLIFTFLLPFLLIFMIFSPPLGSLLLLTWGAYASSKLLGQELEYEIFNDDKLRYQKNFSLLFATAVAVSFASYLPFVSLVAPFWLTLSMGHLLKKLP